MLAALVVVPAALAWVPVAGPVTSATRPSVIRLRSNIELVAYSDGSSTLRVISNGSGAHTIAAGLQSVGQPAIVQTGTAVELYAPASNGSLSGVLRWESKNDGMTWTGPVATAAKSTADIATATVRSDGTPVFVQGSKLYQGLSGELSHPISGSAASLVVDSTNRAQLVVWFKNQYLYGSLDKAGAATGKKKALAARNTGPLPSAADGSGNTFIGWASSKGFTVGTFRAGKLVRSALVATGKPSRMSLAVDSANRVWAIWSQGSAVYVKRSRDAGKTFGAATTFAGSTVFQIAAAASTGHADVFVNDGQQIAEQSFLPGLTVAVASGTATVLDGGYPERATLTGGGQTVTTDPATGTASLSAFPSGTVVSVTVPDYAPASFKAP
jgi:hypothetical protein